MAADETRDAQDRHDSALIAWLRRGAAEADPVPGGGYLAAAGAIGSRELETELSGLVGAAAPHTPSVTNDSAVAVATASPAAARCASTRASAKVSHRRRQS